MKKAIALTLILFLALIQAACQAQASHEVEFYVFGSMGCPACRHLKEVLTQAYGEDSLIFREVSVRENGEKMAALYSIIYPEVRSYPIPLTIIVVDGEPAGSAIGAMEADFWQYIINESLKTGKFMIADAEGRIYVAEKDPKIMAEIAEIIGLNEAKSSPTTSTGSKTLSPESSTPPLTSATKTVATSANMGSPTALTNYIAMIIAITFLAVVIIYKLKRSERRVRRP